MAITASLIDKCFPAYTLGGFDIPMLAYNEVDSSTYKVGAAIVDSSGEMTESTSSLSTTNILSGIALQAGQNIATAPEYPAYGLVYPAGSTAGSATSAAGAALAVAPLLYVPALQSVVFEATFANNNADVAINTTDVFTQYGFTKDATSGFWYIDKNLTGANAAVYTIGIKNPQDITFGTTKGVRMFFVFRPSFTRMA
jgi:hypothetical protein